ncbi:hypothetical protein [Neolewinella litorea]|uniref:Uncharacterized protein n=1 Tax=Neolewinella litorea TaxID=2562452 RepID=A0A4S4NNU3_9BACT|nr:hypothetical protein [Neolewinella litorea]THH40051.1 hypothetical protein E4021_10645 [Neolewinella litorea]
MYYRRLLLTFLVFASVGLSAQTGDLSEGARAEMAAAEERLAALVETVYTDSSEVARFQACRDLIKELVAVLDRPHSFEYDFAGVPGLSIQYPDDRSFRIFSWELYVDRETYRHYGAIQRNSQELELIPLVDRGESWLENPENAVVTADNWLGYVVYDIQQGGEYQGRPYYFVFGYDSYDAYRRRKILDVLSFDPSGKAVFGMPIFDTYSESGLLLPDRARLILMYGAEATVALRFDDELNGVVFENLVMMPGSYGEGPVNMPDGSYHLLSLGEDGRWKEEEQIFTHKYDEAPREVPKPSEGRDIIGRGGKPKGGGGR